MLRPGQTTRLRTVRALINVSSSQGKKVEGLTAKTFAFCSFPELFCVPPLSYFGGTAGVSGSIIILARCLDIRTSMESLLIWEQTVKIEIHEPFVCLSVPLCRPQPLTTPLMWRKVECDLSCPGATNAMTNPNSLPDQWSSADTDAKVSLLTSVASTLEDPDQTSFALDQLSAPLSDALHSPHHALVLASLKALALYFRALSRAGTSPSSASPHIERVLRQTVKACFSQHGNLVDKTGDPKLAVREGARVALLNASTCALTFPHSPTTPESAAAVVDKAVREQGFGSKNARVREASIRYIAALRTSAPSATASGPQTEQLPPLRPYLPLLIQALEDSDPTVREAAKESVVAIFADTRISDGARAELKREISKGSVRKSTVEHVLSKVFGGGGVGASSAATAPSTSDPPTLAELEGSGAAAPQPAGSSQAGGTALSSADIAPVYIASARDLEQEFHRMVEPFEGKETEHNWQPRDKSISRIRGMLKGDVVRKYGDGFVKQIKLVSSGIIRCMLSLRTTLAVSAVYLVAELAESLKSSIDPLFEPFFSALVKLSAGTKRLLVAASEAAMSSLLTHASCIPKMCQLISVGMAEKSAVARTAISAQLPVLLREHGQRDKTVFDASGSTDLVDRSLRKALTDATPSVREKAREAYWVFFEVWKPEAERIAASLDVQGRAQLEKSRKSKPSAAAGGSTPNASRPASSASNRPSMRDMIAARKAAAKQQRQQESQESDNSINAPMQTEAGPSELKPNPISTSPRVLSTPGTPTRRPMNRPSASGSSTLSRSIQEPRRSSLARPSSRMTSSPTLSPRRPSSVASSPSSTPQKLPTSRKSMADKSVNLMNFATPATAANEPATSSIDSRSLSSHEADDSLLAQRMAQHDLMDVTVDADSGMALEAMRNQADQAEQTAERLLELAADEEEGHGPPTATLPPSHSASSESPGFRSTQDAAATATPAQADGSKISTPAAGRIGGKRILKEFEDSPAASSKPRPSLLLGSRAMQDSWWLEKAKHVRAASPLQPDQRDTQLSELLAALTSSAITSSQLRKLSRVSHDYPLPLTDNDAPNLGFWSTDKRGSRLVYGVLELLAKSPSPEVKESGMLLLKDVVCHQPALTVQYETQLFMLLLTLRQDPAIQVSAASGAILDLYLQHQDPLSTLSTLRSCLANFAPTSSSPGKDRNSARKSFSFGLKGLSALFQGLPAEVLEDEIPLTRPLILQALNSNMAELRQSGIMALVAAQSVIQDEQRLFGMFNGHSTEADSSNTSSGSGGLTEQQMALATYYFAKAGSGT